MATSIGLAPFEDAARQAATEIQIHSLYAATTKHHKVIDDALLLMYHKIGQHNEIDRNVS